MLRTTSMATVSRKLSYYIGKKGQLNLAGINAGSKAVAEELLLKDAEQYHCFFRSAGLHNHLSHHLLAAYDLGAAPELLKKIDVRESKIQRPIFLEEGDTKITIRNENWVQYLGKPNAYGAYVQFFSEEIAANGVPGTLEKYLFDKEVNASGANMLTRIFSGAVHPFIQIGYGLEFGIDTLIATGLAQTCVTTLVQGTVCNIDPTPPKQQISLLELLRRVQDDPALKPITYNPNTLFSERIRRALADGGTEVVERLCALYHISDDISNTELEKKIEECIFISTLLLIGTGRKGRKPRLDFFLMHLVTSSIFLRPFSAGLRNVEHKAALLRSYVPVLIIIGLARGRPRINPELAMSFSAYPRPPSSQSNKPSTAAIGNPMNDEDYNPWPALINGCLHHSDSHVLKAMRTFVLAAQHYGDRSAGQVPGIWRDEVGGEQTHNGISTVDGTLFVRAAGVMMDTLGWSAYGQEEGEWDRSALGWDAAWESGD